MKIFMIILSGIIASSIAIASNTDDSQTKLKNYLTCNQEATLKISYANLIKPEQIENSGCCSWHQGVCGCSAGRLTCCDGTYSPGCSCYK